MTTRSNIMQSILAEGREPDSIWLNERGGIEVRYVDGGVAYLHDAAVGSREFNRLSRKAWHDATDCLLSIAMLCGWENSDYEHAISYIREFPTKVGQASQIYPVD